jgi:hypothetical protein
LQPLVRFVAGVDGQRLESEANLPPAGRLRMPADWSALFGRGYCGRVRHVRRFNRPTGLTAKTGVRLVCAGAVDAATVTLNGRRLGRIEGPAAGAAFDITATLAPHNELVVDVELELPAPHMPDRRGGLVGEVRLEILETGEMATRDAAT